MGNENLKRNEDIEDVSEKEAWQSLGQKSLGAAIAEQIASHTAVGKNGESAYVGMDLPEEIRAKVEKTGFVKSTEEPRGTSEDGKISADVYPQLEGESSSEYETRLNDMQTKVDSLINGEQLNHIDEFWNKNPNLLEEARELQAPLSRSEFVNEGFSLREYEDGSIHIWALTPDYKDWLNSPEDEREKVFEGFKYEDVDDRRKRLKHEANIFHYFMKAYGSNIVKDYEKGNTEDIFNHEFIYPHYPYGIEKDRIANRVLNNMKQTRDGLNEEEKAAFFAEAEKEALLHVGVSAFDYPNVRERLEFHMENDKSFKDEMIFEAIGHVEDRRYNSKDVAEKWIHCFQLDEIRPTEAVEQAMRRYSFEDDQTVQSMRHEQIGRLNSIEEKGFQKGTWGLPRLLDFILEDETWFNKYKEDINRQISELAQSILSKSSNQGNVDVVLKEGQYFSFQNPRITEDQCLDCFKIVGGVGDETIKIPVMHSLLNYITGTRLKNELANYKINLLREVCDVYCHGDERYYYKEPYTVPFDDEVEEFKENPDGSIVWDTNNLKDDYSGIYVKKYSAKMH